MTANGHWFHSARFDLSFFHLPVWACWLLAFALPVTAVNADLPVWVWVLAVLCIDVGHVWSSIYRTYLDPVTRKTSPNLLRWVPIGCFFLCFALALHSDATFWRVLAYIAAYHFVKQQVGVTALYRARQLMQLGHSRENPKPWIQTMTRIDKIAVYAATVGPLIWWHAHLPRKISWFVQGDFVNMIGLRQWFTDNPVVGAVLSGLFYFWWIGALVVWLAYHLYLHHTKAAPLQWGKLLWVLGTAVNWWLGLVYFDSDLVFTLTNVVAHGVPYYGLMALHGANRLKDQQPRRKIPTAIFLIPLLLLAFTEEYFWDSLLWHDFPALFGAFLPYGAQPLTGPFTKAMAIALLSLPQTVHYVLDGFIWKFGPRNPDLKQYLFPDTR